MKKLSLLLLTPFALFAQIQSLPDVAATEFTTTTNASQVGPNYVLGYQFTVKAPVTLTNLGAVLQDADLTPIFGKLPASLQVGLWDDSQNLLASTTVTLTHPKKGHFHYAPVPNMQLLPGVNYTIAGLVPAHYSTLSNVPGFAAASIVNFTGARSLASTTLAFPAKDVLNISKNYFGASFTFAGSVDSVAVAGPDQKMRTGDTVTLDGSKSFSGSGALTYQWTLVTVPNGSAATLTGANTVNPTFVPDLAGIYVAQLIVSDGLTQSPASTVLITVKSGVGGPLSALPVVNQ